MKKKFLFMIPLCLFIIDYFLIKYQVIQPIDWFIYHLVQNLKCDFMTSFFKLCSTLGSTWFYVILVLTLVILKNKKDIWVGIHLLIIQGMNRIIKALVKRPRPPQIYHLVKETNYSFPSGHSMSAMIGYGLLVLEVQKSSLKYKKVIEIFLMMMIFLIGLSRIYLGVHYFSDVIGGFLLSLECVKEVFLLDIDIISGLYHYGLTIIKYEQDYCLVDLKTQEIYEKMSIYYIRRLLRSWNKHRKNIESVI